MDLSRIILGPLVTEKTERLKASHTYTLRVVGEATKLEVVRALESLYDVEVDKVRMAWVRGKVRSLSGGKVMEKRHRMKKALVSLASKSKPLDLVSFKK